MGIIQHSIQKITICQFPPPPQFWTSSCFHPLQGHIQKGEHYQCLCYHMSLCQSGWVLCNEALFNKPCFLCSFLSEVLNHLWKTINQQVKCENIFAVLYTRVDITRLNRPASNFPDYCLRSFRISCPRLYTFIYKKLLRDTRICLTDHYVGA